MVMMTAFMAGAPARGRMVSRSISPPTTAVARQAARMARGNGSPIPANQTDSRPPSITNSPWAKLMMPVVLKIMVNPSPIKP